MRSWAAVGVLSVLLGASMAVFGVVRGSVLLLFIATVLCGVFSGGSKRQKDPALETFFGDAQPARTPSPAPDPDAEEKKRKRDCVMEEVIATERSYIGYLEIIREVFIQPLRESGILSEGEIRDVFSVVEVIENLNKVIILEKVEAWSPDGTVTPGDIFQALTSQASFLNIYSSYINNYDAAISKLAALRKSNQKFNEFISVCNSFFLISYIIIEVSKR